MYMVFFLTMLFRGVGKLREGAVFLAYKRDRMGDCISCGIVLYGSDSDSVGFGSRAQAVLTFPGQRVQKEERPGSCRETFCRRQDEEFRLKVSRKSGAGWRRTCGQQKKGCNRIVIAALNTFAGAEEKTRTFTGKPQLDPEPSASTNSATSATRMNMLPVRLFVKTFLTQAVKKHTVRLL